MNDARSIQHPHVQVAGLNDLLDEKKGQTDRKHNENEWRKRETRKKNGVVKGSGQVLKILENI